MKRSRSRASVARAFPSAGLFALLSLWALLFAYAGRPIRIAATSLGLEPFVAWLALLGLAVIGILPAFFRHAFGLRRRSLIHWAGYLTVGIFSLLLTFTVAGDFVRLLFAGVDVRLLSYAILGTTGLLTLVGLAQARCPRVRDVDVPIENLPQILDGYRIAHLSDVHIGPTIQRRFVTSLVERTNAIGADAIVITGDLVDGSVDDLREHVAPLRDLSARDGVYFVTGNHEYYWHATDWLREVTRLGITALQNEHRVVHRDGAKIVFAGVNDPASRKQDVAGALTGAPADALKVLLAHRPQAADDARECGVDLQLSGHTHGGQFFPFNLVIRWFQPIVTGLHRVGGMWLFVSRGTGYWGPPSRLGVGGEIAVVTLRSQSSD